MPVSPEAPPSQNAPPRIEVVDLDMAYSGFVIQRNLNFTVRPAEIFVIMGGSGSGKSTLLRHLIGLRAPARGDVFYDGESLWTADPADREEMMRQVGVVYQSNALWSSMTLSENVALLLEEFTDLSDREIRDAAALKLALVGLAGFEDAEPAGGEEAVRPVGVVYPSNALWSAMTLSESVALLLEEFTDLSDREIRDAAALKLALVGLAGFEDFYPAEVSGGMEKRAALAR